MLVVFLTLSLSLGCDRPVDNTAEVATLRARVAVLENDTLKNGRYQIVNPTPAHALNIMLIDTKTGKTWRYCVEGKDQKIDDPTVWCDPIKFSDSRGRHEIP